MNGDDDFQIRPIHAGRAIERMGVVAVVALVAAFGWGDWPVIRWAWAHRKQWLWNWPNHVTELGDAKWWIPGLIVAGIIAMLVRRRRWAVGLLHAAAAVIAAGLLVDLIKIVMGRCRPSYFFETGARGFNLLSFRVDYDVNSFPSGHASNVAALCTAAWLWRPRWWWLWVVLWATVASTRVLLGVHWPSDVIAGSYLGLVISLLLYQPVSDLLAGWMKLSKPTPSPGDEANV